MGLRIVFTVIGIILNSISFGQKVNLLIGSSANADTDGVYVYEFDSSTGEANFKLKSNINRPSYMTVSKDEKQVYVITEGENISSFKFDKPGGELIFQNKQTSGGKGPIHISTDKKSRYIFASNYDGGSLTVLPIINKGHIGAVSQTFSQQGRSVDTVRQTKPYVHSAVLSPDDKFLFSSDLGTDRINIYTINKSKSGEPLRVSAQGSTKMPPGSGPRFFTFHPLLMKAYGINELNGSITVFDYNGKRLEPIQTVSMLDKNFKGKSGAADLHVSPDGKFLYGSNRGDANELVYFSIDQRNGNLTYGGRFSTALKRPRYFAIDPSGNFLLLTNQGSDNVTLLKRDKLTGQLSATGQLIALPKPACLNFID